MKKNLFTLLMLGVVFGAKAQSSAGLIAHWDMNGGVSDVSGHSHDGTASNVTPVAGMYGVPNTAYSFNGSTSIITAPYKPDLNVSAFSICAVVNVQGFYTGNCQGNTIFARGFLNTSGDYMMYFVDNPYDGDNCAAIDSTKDVFCDNAGGLGAPNTGWQYSPQIVKNTWYRVITSWDGTNYRVYVNGSLMSTNPATGPAMSTTTDSISIGMDLYDQSSGYPYFFKGYIDDIRLYNRILTDSETVHYGDTCGVIVSQPVAASVAIGAIATYTVNSSIVGATYQWQENSGTGFVNLSNAGVFSGVTTPTLTITGVSSSMTGYLYRCMVANTWGCADSTANASLTVHALGLNNLAANETISVYPNPAHNVLNITAQNITSVTITNLLGQTVYNLLTRQAVSEASVDVSAWPGGVYFVRINDVVRKFVKE
jgi:hypothetical protein